MGGGLGKMLVEQARPLAGFAEFVAGGQPFGAIGPALAQLVARDRRAPD
jgi:hypothetical protein